MQCNGKLLLLSLYLRHPARHLLDHADQLHANALVILCHARSRLRQPGRQRTRHPVQYRLPHLAVLQRRFMDSPRAEYHPARRGLFRDVEIDVERQSGGTLAAADALCLTDLTTNTGWMGYADASSRVMLNASYVHAWLCTRLNLQ